MSNISYASLTRQSGLRAELQVIAHNIANSSTHGFRREGVVFSEHVVATDAQDHSLSMARAEGRIIDRSQGQLTQTGGDFDFAIEGDGFFLVQTPEGNRLTRSGSFRPGPEGNLVTPDGGLLLDGGGAPVFVPPDAVRVTLSHDGMLSADGNNLAQIGLWQPPEGAQVTREAGLLFVTDPEPEPALEGSARLIQGFLEDSNVDPILEVARMIEVQRAYEQGRNLLSADHELQRQMIETLGK